MDLSVWVKVMRDSIHIVPPYLKIIDNNVFCNEPFDLFVILEAGHCLFKCHWSEPNSYQTERSFFNVNTNINRSYSSYVVPYFQMFLLGVKYILIVEIEKKIELIAPKTQKLSWLLAKMWNIIVKNKWIWIVWLTMTFGLNLTSIVSHKL